MLVETLFIGYGLNLPHQVVQAFGQGRVGDRQVLDLVIRELPPTMAICKTAMISPPSRLRMVAPNICLLSGVYQHLKKALGFIGSQCPSGMLHPEFPGGIGNALFFCLLPHSIPIRASCGSNKKHNRAPTGLFADSDLFPSKMRLKGNMGIMIGAIWVSGGLPATLTQGIDTRYNGFKIFVNDNMPPLLLSFNSQKNQGRCAHYWVFCR